MCTHLVNSWFACGTPLRHAPNHVCWCLPQFCESLLCQSLECKQLMLAGYQGEINLTWLSIVSSQSGQLAAMYNPWRSFKIVNGDLYSPATTVTLESRVPGTRSRLYEIGRLWAFVCKQCTEAKYICFFSTLFSFIDYPLNTKMWHRRTLDLYL